MKIAILGARHTGKSYVVQTLFHALGERAPDYLLADTSALMSAIELDVSLDGSDPGYTPLAKSLLDLKNCSLILIMALDWPLLANDGNRDGLLKRARCDARLRQILQTAQLSYVVIYGQGTDRTECALQAIAHHTGLPQQPAKTTSSWQWNCDNCSDGACEHRLFTSLLKTRTD